MTKTILLEEAKARKAGRELILASDLERMEFPPIKYIVPGYVAEGLTILAGKPKLGKSWLCLDWGVDVASGGNAFGSLNVVQGDVLYLALEDNPRRLKGRMNALCPQMAWPERLTFATDWPRLDQGGVAPIKDWIEKQASPRLVIIDTLQKVRRGSNDKESSYANDYAALEELHQLASTYGVAIVLVHHVRKMDADDPLDTVSGTTGLTGAADTILVLNRESNGVTLYGRGRDVEEIETAVKFDKQSMRWSILGEASEVRRSDERSTILDVLDDMKRPMGPGEIAVATGFPPTSVRQMARRMAKDGEIDRISHGKYAHLNMPPHGSQRSQRHKRGSLGQKTAENQETNEAENVTPIVTPTDQAVIKPKHVVTGIGTPETRGVTNGTSKTSGMPRDITSIVTL